MIDSRMFAKFFSFYFLLGSLLPGTNFSDLVRIPDLVDHYQLHVEEAALICEEYSILNFVNDHFINPDKHTQKGHDQDHQDLPLHNISPSLLMHCDFSLFELVFQPGEAIIQFFYVLEKLPGSSSPIFQPPQ